MPRCISCLSKADAVVVYHKDELQIFVSRPLNIPVARPSTTYHTYPCGHISSAVLEYDYVDKK